VNILFALLIPVVVLYYFFVDGAVSLVCNESLAYFLSYSLVHPWLLWRVEYFHYWLAVFLSYFVYKYEHSTALHGDGDDVVLRTLHE